MASSGARLLDLATMGAESAREPVEAVGRRPYTFLRCFKAFCLSNIENVRFLLKNADYGVSKGLVLGFLEAY